MLDANLGKHQCAFRPPQFHFVVLFAVVARDCQRFVKDTAPFLDLPQAHHCFGQCAQQSRFAGGLWAVLTQEIRYRLLSQTRRRQYVQICYRT